MPKNYRKVSQFSPISFMLVFKWLKGVLNTLITHERLRWIMCHTMYRCNNLFEHFYIAVKGNLANATTQVMDTAGSGDADNMLCSISLENYLQVFTDWSSSLQQDSNIACHLRLLNFVEKSKIKTVLDQVQFL